jgi:hypothetical protein
VQLPQPYATIGAMTHSFIRSLECEPRTTYGRLLSSMRSIMRQGGNCNLQGPVGSSIHMVTNFSGVEVSHTFSDGWRVPVKALISNGATS